MSVQLAKIVPGPPSWKVDWPSIEEAFGWFRDLEDCPQDPVYHAEGNVLIHTKMVCDALVADPNWRLLPTDQREMLFWAALLHDVAKPRCTQTDPDGRIRSPGHSRRGQIMSRRILWELGADYHWREALCHLITHHQLPFFAVETRDPQRRVHHASHQTRCDLLTILAYADARGRICEDGQRLLDNIALFHELCLEEDCLDKPRSFANNHSRFCYFRNPDRSPEYEAYDDTRSHVTMLSGLPASGKDTHLADSGAKGRLISLDDIRREMKIDPRDKQGAVVAAAKEMAKVELRQGRPLTWNATNLSRELRGQLIGLFADYNARITIVYAETGHGEQARRNKARDNPVPDPVINRMLERWEPPDLTECHEHQVVLS